MVSIVDKRSLPSQKFVLWKTDEVNLPVLENISVCKFTVLWWAHTCVQDTRPVAVCSCRGFDGPHVSRLLFVCSATTVVRHVDGDRHVSSLVRMSSRVLDPGLLNSSQKALRYHLRQRA